MHPQSNILYSRPTQTDITDMIVFFAEQMQGIELVGYEPWDGDWNIENYHTTKHYESYISDPTIYLEIVSYDMRIIGYLEARQSKKENSKIHVWWVLVDSKFQWRGIAKKLYKHLEEFVWQHSEIKNITASVLRKNIPSVKLHEIMNYSIENSDDDDIHFIKEIVK
jgi:GNAT superfamily N-acetyltransferase